MHIRRLHQSIDAREIQTDHSSLGGLRQRLSKRF